MAQPNMPRTPPTVSVIVPCYNAESTIAETLDSALSQDIDCEVIAIDDGSTDRTGEVLRGYGNRIRAFFGPNKGVSAARNSGIGHARGDWILFLDSDDLLVAGSLRQRLDAAGGQHDAVICDWREFSQVDNEVVEGRLRRIDAQALVEGPELAIARDLWAPPAAVLYRRTLVEKIGGFREDLPVIQDARFLFDAASHDCRFVHAPHVGARYRLLEGSLSRRSPARFWADILLNGQQIEVIWRARGRLTERQNDILAGIYNQAARGLFSAVDPRFFEAQAELRRLGAAPLHAAFAGPLARLIGLKAAQKLLALAGRG
jgi:glycosyltransferase involved in cell wall biosynthesis